MALNIFLGTLMKGPHKTLPHPELGALQTPPVCRFVTYVMFWCGFCGDSGRICGVAFRERGFLWGLSFTRRQERLWAAAEAPSVTGVNPRFVGDRCLNEIQCLQESLRRVFSDTNPSWMFQSGEKKPRPADQWRETVREGECLCGQNSTCCKWTRGFW